MLKRVLLDIIRVGRRSPVESMNLSRTVIGGAASEQKDSRSVELHVGSFLIVVSGNLQRVAQIKDEPWLADCVVDPLSLVAELKGVRPRPDIFIFSQRLPDTEPHFGFEHEYENFAAIPLTTHDHWLKNEVKPQTRNKVRKAEKAGVTTRIVEFDETLVNGISAIYNEMPVRQGRKFLHYQKDIPTVRRENETYLDRATIIGAFLNDELVGFLKMVYVGRHAKVMQILAFARHRDKAVTNALLSKAVEICCSKNLTHLVYANYAYGNKGEDSLSDFKRGNAFVRIDIPKYYVPLTLKGRAALALKLHRSPADLLPRWLIVRLLAARKWWFNLLASRRETM